MTTDEAFASLNKRSPDERYAALISLLFQVLLAVKLPKQDKHDALSDLSDMLDGIQPSARSGIVRKS
jgi:hypothetical protein